MSLFGIILLILMGFILDAVITLHTRWVAEGRPLLASGTSFLYLLSSFFIWEYVLIDNGSFSNKLAYSLGAAIGCYCAVKIRKKTK
jgi:uncharacterized protein YebE (UPF0316 family)